MRRLKTAGIIVILSFIVFQFQNCGSPPDGFNGRSTTAISDSGAGLIDDLPNKKLTFVESLVVSKHDKNAINYDGLCSADSDGQNIEWVLEEISSREVILDGNTKCERGGFRISIDSMLDISCNVDYELIPFMGEFEDKVIIRRKCEPLTSVQFVDEKTTQQKVYNPNIPVKACYYELEKDENSGLRTCYKTCYSSDKLYNRDSVDLDSCVEE